MIDNLSSILALFAAMSVAVERVVELIKGFVPFLANPWSQHENIRRALIQLLTVFVGAIVASQMKGQLTNTLHVSAVNWGVYMLVGLVASGGSGLWNHTLDIVRAVKVNKELNAAGAMPDQQKPKALAAAAAKA